jgi:hypothetical protein
VLDGLRYHHTPHCGPLDSNSNYYRVLHNVTTVTDEVFLYEVYDVRDGLSFLLTTIFINFRCIN